MQRLYILYDDHCGLCSWAARWMLRQPTYLGLTFIPAHSGLARTLFPNLTHVGGPEDLVVISDVGGVYRGGDAWLMCLYALVEYREWSLRLARPALRPLARSAFAMLSKQRSRISHWLRLASEAEIAETLLRVTEPPCSIEPAGDGHVR
jgi:predicted DCC family thiol-disulfide oxidoreductase YuxK